MHSLVMVWLLLLSSLYAVLPTLREASPRSISASACSALDTTCSQELSGLVGQWAG